MKRDMELIRKILLLMEEGESAFYNEGDDPEMHVEGHSDAAVGFHVFLLADAGLIVGTDASDRERNPYWVPAWITWEGALIRNSASASKSLDLRRSHKDLRRENRFTYQSPWEGYEFMEVARNDTTWNKAKAIIKDKGVTASFTVLSQFLTSIAKGQLGI